MLDKCFVLLSSSQPDIVRELYKAVGFAWKKVIISEQQFDCVNFGKIFIFLPASKAPESDTSIFLVDQKDEILFGFNSLGKELLGLDDMQQSVNLILKEFVSEAASSSKAAREIILVLRANSIGDFKDKLVKLGDWQEEQHGAGPKHYCLAKPGLTIEIYPERKASYGFIELVLEGFSNTVGPQAFQEFVLDVSEVRALCRDPDGRVVNFLKKKSLK